MKFVQKLGLGVLGAAFLLTIASLVFVWWIGAWNIVFPKHTYETTPPEIATDFGRESRLRVLAFTFVLESLGSMHVVLLKKNLQFRRKLIPDELWTCNSGAGRRRKRRSRRTSALRKATVLTRRPPSTDVGNNSTTRSGSSRCRSTRDAVIVEMPPPRTG